ncbi:GNAT family N-acetyltransferase [Halorubellus sp. JP-L1]|uniref:GNAT family N-acetyltransferase n=1 Tax=Halorubellus sp. JP-L1 TaxID=2715753 RepID=UPI00140D1FB5|nr:GNAT family N-acetyltransferase [Halorubellus sp. JP-L1]NHN41224.1 GNAT family N-acetyltransferase [Halorubellus sp. JP-L1]
MERDSSGSEDAYVVRERAPTPDEFQRLRAAAGMTSRPREGVERGLPNSLFAVVVEHEPSGEVVGMGRIVGDDGTVYHVCDMAVHPDHQRRGLGTRVMNALVGYVEETAPAGAYVNLMADVDGFYERFGFEETRPASKGMYARTD